MASRHDTNSKNRVGDEHSHSTKRRRRNEDSPQYGSQLVSVVVGENVILTESKTFLVHKDLLTRHSDFFNAALSKSWKEGTDNKVTLEEEEPEAFEVFMKFLNTGQLSTMNEGDHEKDADGSMRDSEWGCLVDCWVFGEHILSASFKDAITDATIDKVVDTNRHPLGLHRSVYSNSAGTRGMRRLLTDLVMWRWDDESLSMREDVHEVPDFFFDVAIAMNKIKQTGLQGSPRYETEKTCIYHDHGDEAPCYKTMF